MRGVVPLGGGRIEVREVPDPRPGPGEAVVALRNAGICGSDLHTAHNSWAEIGERQNLVIGHEASGVVAEVGAGVSPALVGTRVSVYHYRGCGLCRHCLAGEIVFCAGKRGYGWHVHGADADYLLTDARNCCPLPDQLTHLDGSFLACAAGTAYAALRKLEAVPGAPPCAVVGLGPVGLAAALLARAMGWQVIGLDRIAERRAYAEAQGITTVAPPAGGGGASGAPTGRLDNAARPRTEAVRTGSGTGTGGREASTGCVGHVASPPTEPVRAGGGTGAAGGERGASARRVASAGGSLTEPVRGVAGDVGGQEVPTGRVEGAAGPLTEAVRAATGGADPGRVFDASGSAGGLAAALEVVGRGGRVVTVGRGMWPLRFAPQVNVADLIRKQAQVMGSWVLPIHYYYDLVDLMVATGTSFAPLDAGRFPIADAARAFAEAEAPNTLGKVSLVWPDR